MPTCASHANSTVAHLLCACRILNRHLHDRRVHLLASPSLFVPRNGVVRMSIALLELPRYRTGSSKNVDFIRNWIRWNLWSIKRYYEMIDLECCRFTMVLVASRHIPLWSRQNYVLTWDWFSVSIPTTSVYFNFKFR